MMYVYYTVIFSVSMKSGPDTDLSYDHCQNHPDHCQNQNHLIRENSLKSNLEVVTCSVVVVHENIVT